MNHRIIEHLPSLCLFDPAAAFSLHFNFDFPLYMCHFCDKCVGCLKWLFLIKICVFKKNFWSYCIISTIRYIFRSQNQKYFIFRSILLMCFGRSKHGCFDAGVGGVRDVARLVLQHRGCSELRGVAITGPELHSVHRGLSASARFVKKHFTLLSVHHFVKPAPDPLSFFLSHFSEVGWSWQVQRERDQTVLICLQTCNPHTQQLRIQFQILV